MANEQAEALSYEQARDQLANVVKRLEAGGLTLEDSLVLWERGERLAAICAEWLEGARARLATAMARSRTGDADDVGGGGGGGGRASGVSSGAGGDPAAPF